MTVKFFIDLDRICKRYDITQIELAERTGLKQPSLARIKKSKSVSLGVLNKIATALGEKDPSRLLSVENKN
ncbi:helix-turn-helix transcriptional regulator [Bacillus sp. FJAT-51639]|uniref:Helix-turn-helix transcriptional regulator n=1 Tax=Bacillus bruguierae TaxID=3127667 RepID=A0ABU8FDH9_9BACI